MSATSERVAFTLRETERAFHLAEDSIMRGRRRKSDALARAVASVLLNEVFGLSSTEIGEALHLDHSTVVRHWKRLKWMARAPELGGPIEEVRQELLKRYPQEKVCKPGSYAHLSTAQSTGRGRFCG